MGQKGDKHTNEAALATKLLLEKLSTLNGLTSKKMFGGHGVFHEGKMFAMINSKAEVFMKADPEKIGLGDSERHGKMPYFKLKSAEKVSVENWTKWAYSAIKDT